MDICQLYVEYGNHKGRFCFISNCKTANMSSSYWTQTIDTDKHVNILNNKQDLTYIHIIILNISKAFWSKFKRLDTYNSYAGGLPDAPITTVLRVYILQFVTYVRMIVHMHGEIKYISFACMYWWVTVELILTMPEIV